MASNAPTKFDTSSGLAAPVEILSPGLIIVLITLSAPAPVIFTSSAYSGTGFNIGYIRLNAKFWFRSIQINADNWFTCCLNNCFKLCLFVFLCFFLRNNNKRFSTGQIPLENPPLAT
jgi:hypothetical protein